MKQAGMTTLEIVIGIALGTIVLGVLLRFIVLGFPVSRTTYFQARANEVARVHLLRLATALRETQQSETGSFGLVEALPQKIVFYSDVDGDGSAERIRYELVGTEFRRGLIQPTGDPVTYPTNSEAVTTISTDIRNGADAVFTYYDGDYPAEMTPLNPSDLTEVKYIQFLLRIDVDPAAPPDPVEVRSQVQLRNLKVNLGENVAL